MSFTYDPTTSAGRVRLLCNDNKFENQIFEDAEIASFLTLEDDNVKRSAALALETIASNEVLVQKVIRILDLSTNGAAEAVELLKRAALLREQADTEEYGDDGGIEVAEMVVDNFSAREILASEATTDDE